MNSINSPQRLYEHLILQVFPQGYLLLSCADVGVPILVRWGSLLAHHFSDGLLQGSCTSDLLYYPSKLGADCCKEVLHVGL